MTTLRHLASELGLSITTVSRALDGYDDVAAETQRRVKEAAQKAGYRPNPVARQLRRGTSDTIALVMPTEPGRFYEPAFVTLLEVIGQALAARHFDLMLLAARPGAEEDQIYQRLIRQRRADACIVVRTREQDGRVAALLEAGMPFVCHGRTGLAAPYAFVDGDGEAGFRAVTERLIARGHRRIAHIGAPKTLMYAQRRAAGWAGAMQAAGLAADLVRHCPATEADGEAAARALLAGKARPTALVCATDRIAIGAMQAAQEAGLTIGSDIAICGHDNIHAGQFTRPPLTSMELDVRAVGESIVAKLFDVIAGKPPTGDVFALRQILRASTGESRS